MTETPYSIDEIRDEYRHYQNKHDLVDGHEMGRRWVLLRYEDVSGVSGDGVVAQGIEFPDGRVAYRWHTTDPTMEKTSQIADSIDAVETIHGHSGSSEIVYVDGEDS